MKKSSLLNKMQFTHTVGGSSRSLQRARGVRFQNLVRVLQGAIRGYIGRRDSLLDSRRRAAYSRIRRRVGPRAILRRRVTGKLRWSRGYRRRRRR
jgi:hypothetical protein